MRGVGERPGPLALPTPLRLYSALPASLIPSSSSSLACSSYIHFCATSTAHLPSLSSPSLIHSVLLISLTFLLYFFYSFSYHSFELAGLFRVRFFTFLHSHFISSSSFPLRSQTCQYLYGFPFSHTLTLYLPHALPCLGFQDRNNLQL